MVTEVHLGRYVCVVDRPGKLGGSTPVTAMRARELGRRSVVVGDQVALVGDVSGDPDQLARIVRVFERRSVLRRTADDDDSTPEGRLERVVVANADQLVMVSALIDPPPRTGFIDRCLVAAYAAGIDPLLCLTKADLVAGTDGPVDALRDYYAALSLPFVLCRPDEPLEPLVAALHGRMSVLVGHSGVGKSTLVNRLVPDAARAVGAVSAVGKGRHVSSSAVALPLARGPDSGPAAREGRTRKGRARKAAGAEHGWIIDTPGVRSFGLAHVSADDLLDSFTDLVEGSAECPPNCDHAAGGSCALDTWVAAGNADPRRLASYRRLSAASRRSEA
jgi:ribosome biogenesis GTPase